ncbi:MAG: bacillithiol biosynthesis cysteine-adding enzyme BshC [Chitinophagaceae bacterium]
MDCTSARLPYRQTGHFTKTVLDYIDQAAAMRPFFGYPPSVQGIRKAIAERKNFGTDRDMLVEELQKQYASLPVAEPVSRNIESLLSPDTFTITTAHQNNLFTGPLYFVYKILHTIKLAAHLQESLPEFRFVPVFYMGSEDADLAELNHIHLGGEKLSWSTRQTGAVGRMVIDKEITQLIGRMEGQLGVLPHGSEVIELLKSCYVPGEALQSATLRFVHALFGQYGLLVLIADTPALKRQMKTVFEDDLLHQTASDIVQGTVNKLEQAGYKVQANPREINLFYLQPGSRERIEKRGTADQWQVVNTDQSFSRQALLDELDNHPERFSPNVILRGLFQETILPNVAFIGGGGETAYWLQLKELFARYNTPFPVLVLRNSFLVLEQAWREKISRLGFTAEDFFLPEQALLGRLVQRDSANDTRLNGALTEIQHLYEGFKKQAAAIDTTLMQHVDALKLRTVYRLQELEKKMLRAEKRKFVDQQRQIRAIKHHLFPANGLQERYENISYYYAKWGSSFIDQLYRHSPALEQEFVILQEP